MIGSVVHRYLGERLGYVCLCSRMHRQIPMSVTKRPPLCFAASMALSAVEHCIAFVVVTSQVETTRRNTIGPMGKHFSYFGCGEL